MKAEIEALLAELRSTLEGIHLLRHCPLRALDMTASFGERLCAVILAAYLGRFHHSVCADARHFVTTDDQFTNANVDFARTNRAVRAFSRDGNLTLGADASVAAGPVGREAEAAVTPTAAIYTYSRTKGLFAGVSLEGTVIATQKTANDRYYGRPVSAGDILSGSVSAPPRAAVLERALGR